MSDKIIAAQVYSIISHMSGIAFNMLVDAPTPDPSDSIEAILGDIAGWLGEYRNVVARQVAAYASTSRRLAELEHERATVRSFFGLPEDDMR